jgi:Helicase HerA, central domain
MTSIIEQITRTDLFKREANRWATGKFIGRPFSLNYSTALLLVADAWKQKAAGIPQGCFLLAYYQNEIEHIDAAEAILLRVIQPTQLPTDSEIIGSMIEYYKDDMRTGETRDSQLDTFTRYEFSFSGLQCSVLGSFYRDPSARVRFGADLENFFSAHNYTVIKPNRETLTAIVNYREEGTAGGASEVRIGRVRYSSSRRFQSREVEPVPVYVVSPDFAGKRTALFGMTRTGKSNTLKKIIQACVEMSGRAPRQMSGPKESPEEVLRPFTADNNPKYPIGQIIFDINGEYANPNLQDQGTAIFDLYRDQTIRYSTIRKEGFREMKVNFYSEIETGFDLIRAHPTIAEYDGNFVKNFTTVDLSPPDSQDVGALTRHQRRIVVYQCILKAAGFTVPQNLRVTFSADKELRAALAAGGVDFEPNHITLEQATLWWEKLWEIYRADPTDFFDRYKKSHHGREWADEDLQALLVMLTRKRTSGGKADCSGFRVIRELAEQHTDTVQTAFEIDILNHLRDGKIVIVDLSLGNPNIQRIFSERVCKHIFNDAMQRFTQARTNNFIQFYFEEAHNLFPKKEDKDLSQIYNRLAKEGAKLHLGLIYATQEVSSISANILKATQNWFISHLNNDDEIKELRKYYDFEDFAQGLIRFSQSTDKGFIRMKTYSNPFVIPIQVDRFPADAIPGA